MGYLQQYLPKGLSLSVNTLQSKFVTIVLTMVVTLMYSLFQQIFAPLLLWLYLSALIMAIFLLGISIHLYNKLNISTKELSSAKSTIETMQKSAINIKENVLGMASIHDAQQNKNNELIDQQKKIAQLLQEDIRITEDRYQFLSSLERSLITPQVVAELKYISQKIDNYRRFSEILLKSQS